MTFLKIIQRYVFFLAAALLVYSALFNPAAAGEGPELIPSYRYIMVYGTGELEVGDVVEFYDPVGTLCGRWVVEVADSYGLMPVYGDDPMTPEVREGAREGDLLRVFVNGREVYPVGGPPVWVNEGETRRVDL